MEFTFLPKTFNMWCLQNLKLPHILSLFHRHITSKYSTILSLTNMKTLTCRGHIIPDILVQKSFCTPRSFENLSRSFLVRKLRE